MTTKGSIKLKVNMEYFVQVAMCTLEDLCSVYTQPTLISKSHLTFNPGKVKDVNVIDKVNQLGQI